MTRIVDIVRQVCPKARREYIAAFDKGDALLQQHGITKQERAAIFLANAAAETGGLTITFENMRYTTQARLHKVFGAGNHTAALSAAECKALLRRPEALAERVYGMGNKKKAAELGNVKAGDAYERRGGGLLQTTGLANYIRMSEKCGVDFVGRPELIVSAKYALLPALTEWTDGKLNAYADKGDLLSCARRINIGNVKTKRMPNGWSDRQHFYRLFLPLCRNITFGDAAAADLPEPADAPLPAPRPACAPAAEPIVPAPVDPVTSAKPASVEEDVEIVGDPEIFWPQYLLKAMKYNPGKVDGDWGGMTSGAINGFINDRHLAIAAPTSLDMFNQVRGDLRLEIEKAHAQKFKRPVSDERAKADTKTVSEVAPEVVPVRRNYIATKWAAFCAFVAALWDAFGNQVTKLWNFFTDHKDDLPTDSGLLESVKEHLGKVPMSVWLVLGGFGFLFVAINSYRSLARISASVASGERQ